jgi:D-glycero-alpha-D-manno-heptose-7-phosphate kinase
VARTLTARAPTRIDLGGGWTDVPPYTSEQGGVVCNLAISRYATATLAELVAPGRTHGSGEEELPPLVTAALRRAGSPDVNVSLAADYPVGSGLGGSSAAGVALAGALVTWSGEQIARGALAERSRSTEVEELGVAGGCQDHYAAAFGGALELRIGEEVDVAPIELDDATRAAIAERWILVYTGESRISAATIAAVLDGYRERDRRIVGALARMKGLAQRMAAALAAGDLDDLAHLVAEHWVHQRALHPTITTARIDAIMDEAERAGALGGKALGASGGGCVVLMAPAGGDARIREAVAPLGEVLSFQVDTGGFTIVQSDPSSGTAT